MAQRDAVLGGAGGVERILHRNAHLLEREHGVAAQVASRIGLGKVKVTHVVQGLGDLVVLKVVILQFGAHVHDKAGLFGTIEHSAQTFAGVARKRLTIGCADVAEHTRNAVVARTPRKDLERRRIGESQHVGLFGRGKALDSRAVKAHALFEGDLKVLGADGKALKTTQHVDEPQTHKTDVTLFDGSEHEVDILLLIHGASLHAQHICRFDTLDILLSHMIVSAEFPGRANRPAHMPVQATHDGARTHLSSSRAWGKQLQMKQKSHLDR